MKTFIHKIKWSILRFIRFVLRLLHPCTLRRHCGGFKVVAIKWPIRCVIFKTSRSISYSLSSVLRILKSASRHRRLSSWSMELWWFCINRSFIWWFLWRFRINSKVSWQRRFTFSLLFFRTISRILFDCIIIVMTENIFSKYIWHWVFIFIF